MKKQNIYITILLIGVSLFSYSFDHVNDNTKSTLQKKLTILIDKNTTKEDLQKIKRDVKNNYNLSLTFSEIDYTFDNYLASITITYQSSNGSKGSCNQKNLQRGINPIKIILVFDNNDQLFDIQFNIGEAKGATSQISNSSSSSISNSSYSYSNGKKNTKKAHKKRKVLHTIKSHTTNKELEIIKNSLRKENIFFRYKNIKRNTNNLITQIELSVTNEVGQSNEYNVGKTGKFHDKPIQKIQLIRIGNNLLFVNEKSNNLLRKFFK